MKVIRNRGFAALVMALMIVVGMFIGTSRSLNRLYDEVDSAFYEGEDGFSISLDLEARIAYAGNYLVVAQRYLDSSNPAVQGLKTAILELQDAKTIKEKYAANNALTMAADSLTSSLTMPNIQLSDKDAQYVRSIPADMASRNDTIARDPYNDIAKEYNDKRSSFPANIFADMMGVPKAEYFR